MKYLSTLVLVICGLLIQGCATTDDSDIDVKESKLTVATVQKKIYVGMSSAGVIEALGSPNVITTDEKRREVWVYDRVSSSDVRSSSGGSLIIVFGQSSDRAKSQSTMTIIIKFDKNNTVRDFTYHSSRF